MDTDRIHRAYSDDGTRIVGRVHGQGPPLVLVHAGLGDGDLDCGPLVPFLRERFTCYLPSTRGRGLSGHNPDLSPGRVSQDIAAFVDSIGEPVGLVAHSGGAIGAFGAAARTTAISGLAAYEPIAVEALDEDDTAHLQEAVARMAALAEEGKLVEAARGWMTDYADEQEMAALAASGWLESGARYVPTLLAQLGQLTGSDEPSPTDPSVLARITAPVLILRGSRTRWRWFSDSAQHVADHVADAQVREVAGTGHSGMIVAAEQVAAELGRFYSARPAKI